MAQREIKFRAWSKVANKIATVNAILTDSVLLETADGKSGSSDLSNVILMQYTGLKDKNGAEIWEGDVVVIDNFNDGDAHEVKFGEYQTSEEHMLCWFYESRSALGLLSIANPCEVIGNIYENPELIK